MEVNLSKIKPKLKWSVDTIYYRFFMEKIQFEHIHNQNQTVHNWTISDQTIYSIFEFPVIFFWAIKSIENAKRLKTPLEKVQY